LAGLKIVGCDVVEVYPAYDSGAITAFLGASAAYEMLTLIAMGSKEVGPRGR
jgi:agmatinase